jgi:hypothetical protein
LRKYIYKLITTEFENPRALAIKTHVKMLTAYSEMTTYTLIQKDILQGGAAITLTPLPSQFIKYQTEREQIIEPFRRRNIPEEDLKYLHLLEPNIQCFSSATYADMVITACMIEEVSDPNNKTLELYKGKLGGTTIHRKMLSQFLTRQSLTSGLTVDQTSREKLREILGAPADDLYKEAETIIRFLTPQHNALSPF